MTFNLTQAITNQPSIKFKNQRRTPTITIRKPTAFITKDLALLAHLPEPARKYALRIDAVGSRVSCNPPPLDTDQDILVLVKNKKFLELLVEDGWEVNDDYDPIEDWKTRDKKGFTSLRKYDLNIIGMYDEKEYDKFMLATRTATRLNLLDKDDRITLFDAICRGE